jgi:hypothetical protein
MRVHPYPDPRGSSLAGLLTGMATLLAVDFAQFAQTASLVVTVLSAAVIILGFGLVATHNRLVRRRGVLILEDGALNYSVPWRPVKRIELSAVSRAEIARLRLFTRDVVTVLHVVDREGRRVLELRAEWWPLEKVARLLSDAGIHVEDQSDVTVPMNRWRRRTARRVFGRHRWLFVFVGIAAVVTGVALIAGLSAQR